MVVKTYCAVPFKLNSRKNSQFYKLFPKSSVCCAIYTYHSLSKKYTYMHNMFREIYGPKCHNIYGYTNRKYIVFPFGFLYLFPYAQISKYLPEVQSCSSLSDIINNLKNSLTFKTKSLPMWAQSSSSLFVHALVCRCQGCFSSSLPNFRRISGPIVSTDWLHL